jgi:hypothetical protein
LGVSESMYYRLCKEYGGLDVNYSEPPKQLEEKNEMLNKLVGNLLLFRLEVIVL